MNEIRFETLISPPSDFLKDYKPFDVSDNPWTLLGTKVTQTEFLKLCPQRNVLTTLQLYGSFPLAATSVDMRTVTSPVVVTPCKASPSDIENSLKQLDATLNKVSNGMATVGTALVSKTPLLVDNKGTFSRGRMTFDFDMTKGFGAREQSFCDRTFQTQLDAIPNPQNRTMLFLPPVTTGWAGLSSIGNWRSTKMTSYIKSVADIDVITHEYGHMLGFGHSRAGKDDYGDKWCFMGSDGNARRTVRSVNAAQTYYAGWMRKVVYADASKTFNGKFETGNDSCLVIATPIVPQYISSGDSRCYTDPLPYPLFVIAQRDEIFTVHEIKCVSMMEFGTTILLTRRTLPANGVFELDVRSSGASLIPVWSNHGMSEIPDIGLETKLPSSIKISVVRSADGKTVNVNLNPSFVSLP